VTAACGAALRDPSEVEVSRVGYSAVRVDKIDEQCAWAYSDVGGDHVRLANVASVEHLERDR